MSFVCSQTDRDKFAARGFDTARIRIAPNALDLPTVCAPLAAEPVLLFLGAFGHEPNRRAAERLIGRIWPLVRARSRNARLLIAGRNPERIAQFPSPPPGVTFTGFAPDLDALYARTRAVCCPMDEGGGTRIKLIEAAGRGKPIVSTAVGAEGLAFVAGREILMGETDGELAAGALQLLGDDALAGAMAAAAFARASLLYSAEAVERGICAEITSVLRRAPDGASSRPALAELPASIAVKAPPCN
jgi:glycosyltransferase involved in cell wall biosynthesis